MHSLRSFAQFPPASELEFGELVSINLSSNTREYTHGVHRYPAKFIPQVPRWGIVNYSAPGDVVLDPFCGSGTTIVEAQALDRRAVGIDLDPLACLLTKAKTQPLDINRLEEIRGQLTGLGTTDIAELATPMEGVRNFTHWFGKASWASLQLLRNAILSADMSDEERQFFLCVFSSILRRVSKADDQTQKTYVSGTLAKTPPPVKPTFFRALDRAIKAMAELNAAAGRYVPQVFTASATEMPLSAASADLIVTSPPYLDSVDYMYNMMVEYFWLGDLIGVPSRPDFNLARRRSVGSKNPLDARELPSELIGLIDEHALPAYRRQAAISYFSSMRSHFADAARVLKDGGHYILVIGNSQTGKGQLAVHDALVELAAAQGLQMVHAFGYRIRRHYMKFPRMGRGGIILMDWIIVLQKRKKQAGHAKRLPLPTQYLAPNHVAH